MKRTRIALKSVFSIVCLLAFLIPAWPVRAQQLIWSYKTQADILFPPVVGSDGTVYFATSDRSIRAVSASGRLLWGVDPGGLPSTGMALEKGVLYFSTSQGELAAYETNGSLAWRLDLHSDIRTIPAVAGNGTIYVGTITGYLAAVTSAGDLKWRFQSGDPILAGPVVTHAGNIIFASYYNLFQLGSDGRLQWETPLGSPVTGELALDKIGGVYFTDAKGNLWSIASNGTLNWQDPSLAATVSPVVSNVSNGVIYLATTGGTLQAIDASSGSSLWTWQGGGEGTPALAQGGLLYIGGGSDKIVYAVDTQTHDATEFTTILPDVTGPMLLSQTSNGPRLCFTSGSRNLYCYKPPSGPDITAPWNQLGAGPRHLFRVDNPPTVSFTSPQNGDTLTGTVVLTADASDDFTKDLYVRFKVGNKIIATVGDPPFTTMLTTTTMANGPYTLAAQVKDSAGQTVTSHVDITVQNSDEPTEIYPDTPPPVFSWQAAGGEKRFRLQFSTDAAFDSIITTSKTSARPWLKKTTWQPPPKKWKKVLNTASDNMDAETPVYWRVFASGEQSLPPLASGTFNISHALIPVPTAPADNSQASYGTPPAFQWDAAHNDHFILEISDTGDFSSGVLLSSSTPSRKWLHKSKWTPSTKKWKKLKNRSTVYWRVQAKDAIGRKPVSTTFTLLIAP